MLRLCSGRFEEKAKVPLSRHKTYLRGKRRVSKVKEFLVTYKNILLHGKTKDKIIGWVILILLAWFLGSGIFNAVNPDRQQAIPTSDFVYQLQQDNVAEMHISNADGTVNGTFKEPTEDGIKNFSSNIPERSETFTQQYLQTGDILWDYSKQPEWVSGLANLLMMVLQIGLLVFAMMWIMSKMSGDSSMFPFGDDDEEKWEEGTPDVTFEDVVGIPEAIEEMTEIITYLKNPAIYDEAGSEPPTGVLLEGSPGNGKSLISQALANEVDCKFLKATGSDFVKLYVGQGPKAIRELFARANKYADSGESVIVFIDELDAIGQKRSAGGDSGADREYSSAVNQLLTSMSDIQINRKPILVIGATNRPEALDEALMRKGRFDRVIQIDSPAKDGRIEILQHYAQGRPFAEPVDFERLAKHTYGFSGADLKNVMNEASTLAARRAVQEGDETSPAITKEDLDEGISRTISGPAMKSRKMNDQEKRQVAYHEAGHAVVQYLIPECDPVQKISIVSRNIAGVGAAMGYVQSYSEEDSYVTTSAQLHAELAALMGGRCSEKKHCGIESAGAYDDLRKASTIAYDMVNKYAFENVQGEQLSWRVEVDGKRMSSAQERLQRNDEMIDEILDRAYETANRIIASHKAQVELIVEILLEDETIDSDQIRDIMEGRITTAGGAEGPKGADEGADDAGKVVAELVEVAADTVADDIVDEAVEADADAVADDAVDEAGAEILPEAPARFETMTDEDVQELDEMIEEIEEGAVLGIDAEDVLISIEEDDEDSEAGTKTKTETKAKPNANARQKAKGTAKKARPRKSPKEASSAKASASEKEEK